MTISNYLASLIRTGVPVLVGLALSWLALKTGFVVDSGLANELVTALAIGGYYAGARALEARWPAFGLLLGWKVAPTYLKPAQQNADGSYTVTGTRDRFDTP